MCIYIHDATYISSHIIHIPSMFHAGSVPCIEGMMRNMSRRARAEAEFNALMELVSDAIREAREHHTQGGVKVCVHI